MITLTDQYYNGIDIAPPLIESVETTQLANGALGCRVTMSSGNKFYVQECRRDIRDRIEAKTGEK